MTFTVKMYMDNGSYSKIQQCESLEVMQITHDTVRASSAKHTDDVPTNVGDKHIVLYSDDCKDDEASGLIVLPFGSDAVVYVENERGKTIETVRAGYNCTANSK